jgi:hypothetical protein
MMAKSKNKPAIAFCRQPVLYICAVICCFVLPATNTHAQNTTQQQKSIIEEPIFIPSPARAAMLSATLPGLGQVYNRKYWKLPIIYAGFGTLAYFVDFNNSNYSKWRSAWLARVDGNPNTIDDFPLHSTHVLERAMNYYRRNLEITYILAAALYLLNILDASVDAHLMDFDVGERLSFGVQPIRTPTAFDQLSNRHTANISFTLRF